ncbi:hypothetical protein [Deinococcus budaensis]|uniref:Uncharacterized protein n=1 Tax=Deinococcus budaensis TaxID=1665626 RepID=A0A7W8GH79_9DEIO|nr:hypothetical protein [Deinococcus budaensis]MBB5235274.1 hypothetical protein [Deinococcus budaensis]
MTERRPLQVGEVRPTASTSDAPAAPPATAVHLWLSPRRVTRLLGWTALGLALINIVAQAAHFFLPDFFMRDWLLVMFDANGEANLPSAFSGGLLLFSALILGAVALAKRQTADRFAVYWGFFAAVFLYLSVDEIARLHDNTIAPMRRLMDFDGVLRFAWVVPYALAVLLILLGSIRFLAHLPAPIRWRFVLAGGLYVGAALGMELVQGYTDSRFGDLGFVSALSIGFEELMEMLGVVVFIHALLLYIGRHLPGFALQFGVRPQPGRPDS